MLRAISEIASAVIVWSVLENPAAAAISRPLWRAVMMSVSRSIDTHTSADTVTALLRKGGDVPEALFKVERRSHPLQRQTELDHRERDVGLDPDYHLPRAMQLADICDPLVRAGCQRVEHV